MNVFLSVYLEILVLVLFFRVISIDIFKVIDLVCIVCFYLGVGRWLFRLIYNLYLLILIRIVYG